jgi:hypothetical protein
VLDTSPDWRWKRAQYERRKERDADKDFVASDDLTVQLAKRFLTTWENEKLQGAPCRELMPGMTFLYDLYMENSVGCTKHALEAALMAKAKPLFIQSKVHRRLTPFIVRLYELIFFDVRDKLDSPFWVEKYIFAPAMATGNSDMRVSNLVWKIIGYHGGEKRLLSDCIRGHKYSNKDADWIVDHVVSENARETLKYVHTSSKLPKELTVHTQQRTIGTWEDKTYKMTELAKELDEDAIPENLMTFKNKLKLMDANKKIDKVEALDDSIPKYANGDLD